MIEYSVEVDIVADMQLNKPESAVPAAQHNLLTADDLAKQPNDGARYELVKGVLEKMPPAGFEHGICAAEIGSKLNVYVKTHQLGYVCGAETGFKIAQNPVYEELTRLMVVMLLKVSNVRFKTFLRNV